nr:2-C-methyl-D-erythritol 4-phosphate cytidylyltransferase [uncultured Peptostreptococcus sp.]
MEKIRKDQVRADAIILAAGAGRRMMSDKNKILLDLAGKPIIAHTIARFYDHPMIRRIVLAIRAEDEEEIDSIIEQYMFKNIVKVIGGPERQDSIYNCIGAISDDTNIVLIHDGARPFVDEDIITRSILESLDCGATCVGVPSKDTVKIVDSDNRVVQTPDRSLVWCAQTPQTFRFDLIREAHTRARQEGFLGTDDASLVERYGHKVKMIMGSYMNNKITTPEDIRQARYIFD